MGVSGSLRAACLLALLLAPALLLGGCGGDDDDDIPTFPGTIPIGALLSLSGNGSGFGTATREVLTIAANQLNAEFAQQGLSTRVQLLFADTQLDPALALQRLQALAAQGVRVVIGPQSSSEAAAIKPFADQNGILIISHGSTAGSLAIPDDNILRIVPDDTRETTAIAALMRQDGIQTAVPLSREDLGNQGLATALRSAFPAQGGIVTTGATYGTQVTDFSTVLAAARAQVDAAGQRPVAVFLAGFDEAALIFDQARNDPVLSEVRWYGTDGIALSNAVITSATASQFAARVGFVAPILALPDAQQARWQPVVESVRAATGIQPDTFALAAYDALVIAVNSFIRTGGASDVVALRTAFVQLANDYVGITGPTTLNAAGDRATGDYGFWAVRATNGSFEWRRVARFIGGNIVRLE